MTIQEITPEDTWSIRQRVMWPDKPIDFVKISDDDQGLHYGLFRNERLASVISCFVNQDEMQFRKFATLVEEQGQGLGTHLLNHVLDVAREKGIRRIWCNARRDKTSFYARFGLHTTGTSFTKEGIEYIVMERSLE
ncbi:GNAT family N-acetyltransferase [Telluribacter sp. SYSU D00476]|uniref:GNAT family N-acetyltransferase n=1 Tax=Telluribacter sp. SYSU D00476 TaxID=2811430 RepID=UPI001FF6FBA4|nr:GNAT family N-acetyltransferase [Telluribacter sp. SYSU D00476]